MIRDMIAKCPTEVEVNKTYPLWHNGEKGRLTIKKIWYRGTGTFYFDADVNVKGLNVSDNLCSLGFYTQKDGAYLVFDDESNVRIDYVYDLIDYLCSFKDNTNFELKRYRSLKRSS